MAVEVTPFVTLAISAASAYAAGDALGAKASFPGIPRRGTIMSFTIIDRDQENDAIDIMLFNKDIAGTADNAAFAPTDAELQTLQGAINMPAANYFDFVTNAVGVVDNIGLPYYAPDGILYFQCKTETIATWTAVDDIRVSISIVY